MGTLTDKEAFLAMFVFLQERYERLRSDDLAALLSDLSLLPDGGTADPAAWQSWLTAIEKAKTGAVDAALILHPGESQKRC